jgi:hypothetical protein
MSSYEVIAEVSKALKDLLEKEMTLPDVSVTISTPDEEISNSKNRINLFLYQITENAQLKNQDWQPISPTKIIPPPLSLGLFYLITPYPKNPSDYAEAHLILGDVMRIFFDKPILTSRYLAKAKEKAKIILNPINIDEMTKIWSAINKPCRLSVGYEISIVQIESEVEEKEIKLVKERKVEIKSYPGPPRIEEFLPSSGKTGIKVRALGNNFFGESIKINFGGKFIKQEDIEVKSQNELFFIIPADLPPYLYDVVVEVNKQPSNSVSFEVVKG